MQGLPFIWVVLHMNDPDFSRPRNDATLMQSGRVGSRPRRVHPGSAPDRGKVPVSRTLHYVPRYLGTYVYVPT